MYQERPCLTCCFPDSLRSDQGGMYRDAQVPSHKGFKTNTWTRSRKHSLHNIRHAHTSSLIRTQAVMFCSKNANIIPVFCCSSSYSSSALDFETEHKLDPVFDSPRMSRRSLRLSATAYGMAQDTHNESVLGSSSSTYTRKAFTNQSPK